MNNKYICQYCGKECKSKLSKSCHEKYCDLNENKKSKEHLRKNAQNTNILLKQKFIEYIKENNYI